MKEGYELNETEKRISDVLKESAENVVPPPFERIAEKIVEGQPSENFEDFFEGEVLPSETHNGRENVSRRWKMIAGISAAAVFAIAAGGMMLRFLMSEMVLGSSKAAADTEVCMDYSAENSDDLLEDNCAENVSYSDLADTEGEESADSAGS